MVLIKHFKEGIRSARDTMQHSTVVGPLQKVAKGSQMCGEADAHLFNQKT